MNVNYVDNTIAFNFELLFYYYEEEYMKEHIKDIEKSFSFYLEKYFPPSNESSVFTNQDIASNDDNI